MRPGQVTISRLHFKHLYWNDSTDLCGAFPFLGTDEVQQCNQDWWSMWKDFPAPEIQEILNIYVLYSMKITITKQIYKKE